MNFQLLEVVNIFQFVSFYNGTVHVHNVLCVSYGANFYNLESHLGYTLFCNSNYNMTTTVCPFQMIIGNTLYLLNNKSENHLKKHFLYFIISNKKCKTFLKNHLRRTKTNWMYSRIYVLTRLILMSMTSPSGNVKTCLQQM